MSDFNVWSYFAKLGVQIRGPKDTFFKDGDHVCGISESVLLTVEDVEEFLHKDYTEFSCQVPGCSAKFRQLQQCEQHYNSRHKHSCATCHKSLPSYHLLELHIEESHDSFFAVLAEKNPSFQCFLPTCGVKFWGAEERRDHGISVHSFPPDFRFDGSQSKGSGRKVKRSTERKENGVPRDDPVKTPTASPAQGNRRERRAARNGGTEAGKEGEGGQDRMEVDGEEVVLRRNQPGRRPVSLARMGERKSVCTDLSPPSLPPPTFPQPVHVRQSFHSASPGALVSPRSSLVTPPGAPLSPTMRFGGSMRLLTNIPDSGGGSSLSSPRYDGSGSPSLQSPRKSKIPVRSNSCRTPKQISFGAGVPRTFQRPRISKQWYQSTQSIHTATDIQVTDFNELKNSLPS